MHTAAAHTESLQPGTPKCGSQQVLGPLQSAKRPQPSFTIPSQGSGSRMAPGGASRDLQGGWPQIISAVWMQK
jgi:hypothetical protein